MKRHLIATFVIAALSPAAVQAGSISFDMRADLEMTEYNPAAGRVGGTSTANNTTHRRDNYRMTFPSLRLDAKGNFSDTTSYRLRFRFNNGQLATQQQRDNLNSAIDFSYVQHTLAEGFSLQLGKFGTEIGGIEGMTSGADLYMTSYAYNGTRMTVDGTTTTIYQEANPMRYGTGAKAIYTFQGQEINLMAINQEIDALDSTTVATGAFRQNRNGLGFVYKGSFMDKTLMPVLSYHEDNLQGVGGASTVVANVDKRYTFAAASLKYEMSPMFIELDYLLNTFDERTTVDQTDKTTTIVGTVGSKFMEKFVLRLKIESSETEIATSATVKTKPQIMGYQAALEYQPTGDKAFRYHLAYVQKDIKPDVAGGTTINNTQSTQQVIAGVRMFHDFLK